MNIANRNEQIAQFVADVSDYVPYPDWLTRYGALPSKDPSIREQSSKGTFKTVAGQSKVIGPDKVQREFKMFTDAIANFIIDNNGNKKTVAKANKLTSGLRDKIKFITIQNIKSILD